MEFSRSSSVDGPPRRTESTHLQVEDVIAHSSGVRRIRSTCCAPELNILTTNRTRRRPPLPMPSLRGLVNMSFAAPRKSVSVTLNARRQSGKSVQIEQRQEHRTRRRCWPLPTVKERGKMTGKRKEETPRLRQTASAALQCKPPRATVRGMSVSSKLHQGAHLFWEASNWGPCAVDRETGGAAFTVLLSSH